MATKKDRATGYIDPDLWVAFRTGCTRRHISASRQLAILIRRQVAAWQLEELGRAPTPPQEPRYEP